MTQPRPEELQAQIHHMLVERLAVSERRFRRLLEGQRDVVFQCDAEGRLTYLNPAWTEGLGFDIDSALGQRLTRYVRVPDRSRLARLLVEGPGNRPMELGFVDARGGVRHMEVSIRDAGEHGVIGSLHDVTDRVEAIRLAAAARDRAEQAARARSTFLAHVSHELRTPLSAILGYADLLASDLTEGPQADHLATIRRSGEHLLALLNDVLDFSKMEAGVLRVERADVDPEALVRDVVETMRPRAEAKGLRLIDDVQALPASLSTDPVRLRQILFNLISNAIQYTQKGGVRVRAGTRLGQVMFAVCDTGPGIPSEQIDELFSPFLRGVHKGDGGRGAGLGLPISRGLATLLGGELRVASTPGKGSRFSLLLEAAGGQTPSVRATPAVARTSRLDGLHIAVVDDSDELRALVAHILRNAGAEVWTAEDGQAAVEGLLGGHTPVPDLVLMDMQMPRLDGYEATRALRRGGYTGVIMALTAHAMVDDQSRCLDAGCDAYLTKPIRAPHLVRAIRRQLRAARTHQPTTEEIEIRALVRHLAADLPSRAARIEHAWAEHDEGTVRAEAHQLKGTAGSFGFDGISKAAASVLAALRGHGDPEPAIRVLVRECAVAAAEHTEEAS